MNIIIKPKNQKNYQSISAENAGWEWLNFETRLMGSSEVWAHDTGKNEMVIVLLSGNYTVESNRGNWETNNGRKDVFSGVAHTLYLPRETQFTLRSTSEILDIAYCWCKANKDFDPQLITPEETPTVIFGGDNATRQFNDLIPPGFGCSRIVCREVYTPSGNWSSFPPHKHDERIIDDQGQLQEAQLEEVYFYKFQKPEAYAIQQVYTKDKEDPLDELLRARHNDVVLIPKGYHPVTAAHGYHCYYLNFLAGSDQSLANTADSDYEWIFSTWKGKDARLPLVTPVMNNQ